MAAEIDNEIREIIDTGYESAKELLTAHIDQLHLVAQYLMEKEKIDGATFDKLMKASWTILPSPRSRKRPLNRKIPWRLPRILLPTHNRKHGGKKALSAVFLCF